jgi:hypothetical protein
MSELIGIKNRIKALDQICQPSSPTIFQPDLRLAQWQRSLAIAIPHNKSLAAKPTMHKIPFSDG